MVCLDPQGGARKKVFSHRKLLSEVCMYIPWANVMYLGPCNVVIDTLTLVNGDVGGSRYGITAIWPLGCLAHWAPQGRS